MFSRYSLNLLIISSLLLLQKKKKIINFKVIGFYFYNDKMFFLRLRNQLVNFFR